MIGDFPRRRGRVGEAVELGVSVEWVVIWSVCFGLVGIWCHGFDMDTFHALWLREGVTVPFTSNSN